jgi:hypothetical protein
MARVCGVCQQPYYRSNRLRLWTGQGQGQWSKVEGPVCTNCMGARQAQKILIASHFRVVEGKGKRAIR